MGGQERVKGGGGGKKGGIEIKRDRYRERIWELQEACMK